MTRSLFVIEDASGTLTVTAATISGDLCMPQHETDPASRVVEYVPRVRCDGCKHYNHRLRRCYHDSVLRIVLREPDWYCADHEPKDPVAVPAQQCDGGDTEDAHTRADADRVRRGDRAGHGRRPRAVVRDCSGTGDTVKPTRLDYVTADGHERRLMVVARHGGWTFGEPVPATVEDVIAVVRGLGKRDAGRVRKELEKT